MIWDMHGLPAFHPVRVAHNKVLAATPEAALKGIRKVVAEAVADMEATGEAVPVPLAEKHYSGEFRACIGL